MPWSKIRWRVRRVVGEQNKMKGLKQSLPSIVVIAVVVGIWWAVVVATESAIFPTPWEVVTGTLELARDGTLWEHIGASLMRVGAGFGIAVAVRHSARAVDGLGARRVRHAEPRVPDPAADLADRLDPDRHPVVRRRQRLAYLPHLHRVGVSDDRADHRRRAHHRETIPARRGELRRVAQEALPAGGVPGHAAADHRRHAHRSRRRLAGGGRGGDDRAALGPGLSHHRFAQRRQSLRPGDRRHDHHRAHRTACSTAS